MVSREAAERGYGRLQVDVRKEAPEGIQLAVGIFLVTSVRVVCKYREYVPNIHHLPRYITKTVRASVG
jgi:hypothetical protein